MNEHYMVGTYATETLTKNKSIYIGQTTQCNWCPYRFVVFGQHLPQLFHQQTTQHTPIPSAEISMYQFNKLNLGRCSTTVQNADTNGDYVQCAEQ